jgi:ABC-type multidrug transport system ATPase subunit
MFLLVFYIYCRIGPLYLISFMDEADLLGDRIAVLSHGRLVACGSSLFLKTRFGVGYTFTLVWSDTDANTNTNTDTDTDTDTNTDTDAPHLHATTTGTTTTTTTTTTQDGAGVRGRVEDDHHRRRSTATAENAATRVADVMRIVQQHVPRAALVRCNGNETELKLPMDGVPRFGTMFKELEDAAARLGIHSFGISMTNLEDVFIHLTKDDATVDTGTDTGTGTSVGMGKGTGTDVVGQMSSDDDDATALMSSVPVLTHPGGE